MAQCAALVVSAVDHMLAIMSSRRGGSNYKLFREEPHILERVDASEDQARTFERQTVTTLLERFQNARGSSAVSF